MTKVAVNLRAGVTKVANNQYEIYRPETFTLREGEAGNGDLHSMSYYLLLGALYIGRGLTYILFGMLR